MSFGLPRVPALALLCLLAAAGGCAVRPGQAPPAPDRASALAALRLSGRRLASLEAEGRFRVRVGGRRLPAFKGVLRWASAAGRVEELRLTGVGPFGGTAFDLLVARGSAWLFLPGEGAVYTGLPDGARPGVLRDLLAALVHPALLWRGQAPEAVPCPEGSAGAAAACLALPLSGPGGLAAVDGAGMVTALRLPGLRADFGDPEPLPGIGPYPRSWRLELPGRGLRVEVDLHRLEPNHLAPGAACFDPAPFLRLPTRPLAELLRGTARAGPGPGGAAGR